MACVGPRVPEGGGAIGGHPSGSARAEVTRRAASDAAAAVSLACDGARLYLRCPAGLYSVGTGYGGTRRGQVYGRAPDITAGQLVSVQVGTGRGGRQSASLTTAAGSRE